MAKEDKDKLKLDGEFLEDNANIVDSKEPEETPKEEPKEPKEPEEPKEPKEPKEPEEPPAEEEEEEEEAEDQDEEPIDEISLEELDLDYLDPEEEDLFRDYAKEYMAGHPRSSIEDAADAWREANIINEGPPEIAPELLEEAEKIESICDMAIKRGYMLENMNNHDKIPNLVMYNILDDIAMCDFVKEICKIYKIKYSELLDALQILSFARTRAAAEEMGEGIEEEEESDEEKDDKLDFSEFSIND